MRPARQQMPPPPSAPGRGGARAALRAAPPGSEAAPTSCYPKAGSGEPAQANRDGVARPSEAATRAALHQVATSALDYHTGWSDSQRTGFDKIVQCLRTVQARDQARRDDACVDASSVASSARSRTSRNSTRRSSKEGSVACYGDIERFRDAVQAAHGDSMDELALGADAETMGDEWCRRSGCTWIGEAMDPAGYWVAPQRLAWCRTCGGLDDWKAMLFEYCDGLTEAERRRHEAGKARDPNYPDLKMGAQGQVKLSRCPRCVARVEGISVPEAITRAFQQTKGKASVAHTRKRIQMFRDSMHEIKNNFKVLIGFANSDEGELALRRCIDPPTVPLDPKSVGGASHHC